MVQAIDENRVLFMNKFQMLLDSVLPPKCPSTNAAAETWWFGTFILHMPLKIRPTFGSSEDPMTKRTHRFSCG